MVSNIEEIQLNCIELLNYYISILILSNGILYQTSGMGSIDVKMPKYDQQENIDAINCKGNDVKLLQIRVPIVAPMKAGKSTTINALIGSECLPTRMDAMTAVPTAVVLKLGENIQEHNDQIQLVLEKPTIEGLEQLLVNVLKNLKEKYDDDGKLESLLLKNIHLCKTAKEFRDGHRTTSDLSVNIDDPQKIQKTLTWVNELIRIAIYIRKENPTLDLSLNTFLKNIPQIHVNYRPIGNQQNINRQKCRVLLIDTPGPNEAGDSDQLTAFVNNQLKTADVILTVVEYGHLNTRADAEIASSITSLSGYQTDQENIFIVINKIDRRQQEDMSIENLRRHVAEIYNVPDDRVFALSSYNALVVQRFLRDYRRQDKNFKLQTSPIVQNFYRTFYPNDWEDQLEECTRNRLELMAEKLYKKSGIADVIDKVLETVLSQVAKRCIHSALDLCDENRRNLMNHVTIRLNGLQLLGEQLRKEVDELTKDLQSLEAVKEAQSLKNHEIICALESELNSKVDQQLEQYKSDVKNLFDMDKEQWRKLGEQLQKGQIMSTTTLVSAAVGAVVGGYAVTSLDTVSNPVFGTVLGALLGTTVAQNILDYFLSNADQAQCENYQKAKDYIESFSILINDLSNNIYKNIEEDVSRALQHSSKQFQAGLCGEAKTIIDRANKHLKSTFQTELNIEEKIKSTMEEIHINPEDIGHSQSSSILSRVRRLFMNEENNNNQIWVFFPSKLRENCLTVLKKNVEQMRKDMIERTMEDMRIKLDSFLNGLQNYLETYRNYAEWCLLDKSRTQENQEVFREQLITSKSHLEIAGKKFDSFRQTLPWNQPDAMTKN